MIVIQARFQAGLGVIRAAGFVLKGPPPPWWLLLPDADEPGTSLGATLIPCQGEPPPHLAPITITLLNQATIIAHTWRK